MVLPYLEACFSVNGGSSQEFSSLPDPQPEGVFNSSHLLLSPALSFTCRGRVVAWQAYLEAESLYHLILFQVWRPLDDNCTYELQGSHSLEDYVVGEDYLVDTSLVTPPLEPIEVEPGDVVGVYVLQGNRTGIGVQQYSNDSAVVYSVSVSDTDVLMLSNVSVCEERVIVGAPIVSAVVLEG